MVIYNYLENRVFTSWDYVVRLIQIRVLDLPVLLLKQLNGSCYLTDKIFFCEVGMILTVAYTSMGFCNTITSINVVYYQR